MLSVTPSIRSLAKFSLRKDSEANKILVNQYSESSDAKKSLKCSIYHALHIDNDHSVTANKFETFHLV